MLSYNLEIYSLMLGFFGTFLFSKFWIKYFNFGYDSCDKIQTTHVSSAIRIGGIINIIFIIFLCYFSNIFKEFPTILLIFIPMIIISTIEDIFQNVSIKGRFLFIFFTSFSLVYFSESALTNIGISIINSMFEYSILGTFFTAIGILVTCNAWNFIDGLNGIASGLGAITLLIFTILLGDVYFEGFKEFLKITAYIFLGFSLINLITGKVFLGDTGSYFLGTLIGWSGVLIVKHHIDFSPWAVFLIIIYPASDITFSVLRRLINRKSPFKSDKLHLHSLLYSYLSFKLNFNLKLINSISGFIILILSSLPGIYCLSINGSYPRIYYGVIYSFIIYICLYVFLSIMIKRSIKYYSANETQN